MSIVEAVSEQLKASMRARDAARTSALRNIRAGFLLVMKEDNSETLDDIKAIDVLRRQAKQRQESIDAYSQGGRAEMAAAEQAELAVILEFLPKLADADTTRAWIDEAIAATGATSAKDKGKVMGALMKAHKAELDGKLTQQLLAERLGG